MIRIIILIKKLKQNKVNKIFKTHKITNLKAVLNIPPKITKKGMINQFYNKMKKIRKYLKMMMQIKI